MRETDVWRSATDAEFDLAMEAMEKLVMNRLYELCVFCLLSYDNHHINESFGYI